MKTIEQQHTSNISIEFCPDTKTTDIYHSGDFVCVEHTSLPALITHLFSLLDKDQQPQLIAALKEVE